MTYVNKGKWKAGAERHEGGTHYRTYTHSKHSGAVIETHISDHNSLHSKYTVYGTLKEEGEVTASWKSRPWIMSLKEAREERTYVVNALKDIFAHKRI
jgi:hypothetical protein